MLSCLESVNSILVRLPNWVGDIVMATPVFESLRRNFPNAVITAHVRGYARGIVEHGPWFDHVIDCNDKTLKGLHETLSQIKPLKPDMALLLPNSTHSYITARLCGINQIYGYQRNLRKYFLSGGPQPIKQGKKFKPLPMQDYYLELCRYLELDFGLNNNDNQRNKSPRCKLYTSPELDRYGIQRLTSYGISDQDKVIGLNPGASFGASKCWPTEHFAKLAELLQANYNCKLLLFVGPGEEAIADAIMAQSKANIINTSPDKIDLAQLKPLIRRCDLLVTNDTGPRHYAVAFDVPSVVLMGPTNPLYTASNLEKTIILRRDLDCSPCHKKICPIDHRCMVDLLPELVMHAAFQLLQANSADPVRHDNVTSTTN